MPVRRANFASLSAVEASRRRGHDQFLPPGNAGGPPQFARKDDPIGGVEGHGRLALPLRGHGVFARMKEEGGDEQINFRAD